jgi:hypothetical protein
MIPVVVGTNPERADWLADCLASIRATSKHRRILIHRDGGYEPAAIRTGTEQFTRFLFIHDSVTVLDPEFWRIIDTAGPSWLAGHPPMCMAVYDTATIAPHLPDHLVSKREAVELEGTLPNLIPMPTIWPDVTDSNCLRMEHRHGRMNLVLGNDLWEKHKGNWGQGPL